MESKVIFDISKQHFQNWENPVFHSIIPLIVIIIFIIIEIKKKSLKKIIICCLGLIFWIMFVTFWILASYSNHIFLQDSMKYNKYDMITGFIQNVKMEYGKSNTQLFAIKDIKFRISDNSSNGGYNKTIQEGGQLYQGECSRIYYVEKSNEKVIIKVEILDKNICKK